MLKRISLAIFSLVAVGSIIATAGLWGNFPKVASARYCITYVNAVCQQYVPAGPTSLTGNETIPADTNLANGAAPQTVIVPITLLGGGATAYYPVTAGSAFYTETISNNVGKLIFTASGTISDARVTAPAAPLDGQIVRISSTNTITAFQFIANTGQTLAVTTPTVITASTTAPQGYSWVYRASDAKWYRIQ